MGELKDRLAKIPREDGRWLLETLPGSLWRASKTARLHQLLTDFDFMQAKLAECGVQALIEDYNLAMSSDVLLNPEQTETLQLIAGTLRLSAHVLASDTTKLAEQLLGRLLSFENPEIVALLEQGKQWRGKPWFCPLTANLTPPGGPLIRTLTGHSSWVNAVAIAPDGKRAVSASDDNTLKLWDLETGTELATLTGHSDDVNAVVIAPDGKRAVSASDDKTLKLWDLETGTELATLRGHSDWVRAVAIAPDGKRAVSASEDETLKLWDLETGTELATLTGHSGSVKAVAITPDGKRAVSASDDNTLKLWDLERGTV
ncbi:WD40 repeat domain-containing protein, partial [Limnospira sp. PMC 1249.20]|uniref:WD40 repeat domain-containing protein n=1 Tax=Limnospira sp. PMC 1249.20 TaxID=2981047 RepID=UPI0028E16826